MRQRRRRIAARIVPRAPRAPLPGPPASLPALRTRLPAHCASLPALCASLLALGLLSGCGGSATAGHRGAARESGAGAPVAAASAGCPTRMRLRVARRVRVGRGAGALAVDGESVWVARAQAGTVTRVSPSGLYVLHAGSTPVSLSVAYGKLWIALRDAEEVLFVDARRPSDRHSVSVPLPVSVQPASGRMWALSLDSAALYPLQAGSGLPLEPVYAPVEDPVDMALAGGELWLLGAREGGLSPVNPGLGRIVRSGFDLPGRDLSGLSASGSTIWLAEPVRDALLRVDARSVTVSELPAPRGLRPASTAIGPCGIWTASRSGALDIVDPRSGASLAPALSVGRSVAALAASGAAVWASDPQDGTVVLAESRIS